MDFHLQLPSFPHYLIVDTILFIKMYLMIQIRFDNSIDLYLSMMSRDKIVYTYYMRLCEYYIIFNYYKNTSYIYYNLYMVFYAN